MSKLRWMTLFAVLCGLSTGAAVTQGAPITAGQDVIPSIAVQTIDLLPGTPFNPTGQVVTVILSARGAFTLDRAGQVGSSIGVTMPQASFQGILPAPLLGAPFDLIAGTNGLPLPAGSITNVIQDPLDPGFSAGDPSSFVSGDFSIDAAFALLVPALGLTLYSDPAEFATFTATLGALPAAPGTVFASSGRIDIYLQLGAGFDTSRDLLVAQSYDRTVTVVPEPGSIVLGLCGGLAFLVQRRIRHRRSR